MNQIVKVQLDQIITDAGTQARAALNEDVVAEYAEAIIAGADMPPVVMFHDGKQHILADGFHRYFAHVKARAVEISADVRKGTKRDAILYSVGANGAHGLRRSNEDKRCAVRRLLADKEWAKWSDRQIADACGVSVPFVGAIRLPAVAARQKAKREASKIVAEATCNPITPEPESTENNPDGYFPWSIKADAAPSKQVEKPEPANDEGPTLVELVDELQRENQTLRAELDAFKSTVDDNDLRAQLARAVRLAGHARREQGIAMDRAAESQKRETYAVRMCRACGKAAGVADPNHTDLRDIVRAVQGMAKGVRHAA